LSDQFQSQSEIYQKENNWRKKITSFISKFYILYLHFVYQKPWNVLRHLKHLSVLYWSGCDRYSYLFYLCPLTGCYVRYGSSSTPPSAVIYGCPCHNPLVCHGLHVVEVPLGEIGNIHYFCCICLCCSS